MDVDAMRLESISTYFTYTWSKKNARVRLRYSIKVARTVLALPRIGTAYSLTIYAEKNKQWHIPKQKVFEYNKYGVWISKWSNDSSRA